MDHRLESSLEWISRVPFFSLQKLQLIIFRPLSLQVVYLCSTKYHFASFAD